mgnify:CR=1 FL=1
MGDRRQPDGVTMAFLTMSMAEIFHSFNMRSQRGSVFTLGSHNKVLWGRHAAHALLPWHAMTRDPGSQFLNPLAPRGPNFFRGNGVSGLFEPANQFQGRPAREINWPWLWPIGPLGRVCDPHSWNASSSSSVRLHVAARKNSLRNHAL